MDTETTTPDAPVTRRRSIVATLKGTLFTFMVLAAVWFALRYVLSPLVMQKEQAAAVISESAEERIKALEDKVAALETATPTAAAAPDTAPLEARIAALESAPKPIENDVPPAVKPEEIEALKTDLEKLKSDDHRYVRSLILNGQLQEAVRAGRPYATELAALETLRPDLKEALVPLAQSSATGIPTLASLQEQFAHTITPALSPEDSGKSLTQNLRSLVKIRKIGGTQTGADDQSVIARAEAKLASGDIAQALQETETLSPRAVQSFAAWQERAQTHLAAHAALAVLQTKLANGAAE